MNLYNLLDLGVADEFLRDAFICRVKKTKKDINGRIISVPTPAKAFLIEHLCFCVKVYVVVDFYCLIISSF